MKKLLKKLIPRKISCAALDIGEREIKFVSLDPDLSIPEPVTVARYPTPPGIFGDMLNEEALSGVLEEMVEQHGLAGTEIISIIGGDKVVTRHISLPQMSPGELNKAVLLEAEKVLPVPLDELVVQHIVLGEAEVEGNKQLEILFAAAPLALTYQYHALLHRFGLVLTALDLPAVALWRLYRHEISAAEDSDSAAAILDIGAERTNLVVTRAGKLKFTRTLPVGGNLLTRSMADMYGVDFAQAQAMKEEDALILNEDELAGADAAQMQLDLSLRDGLGDLVKEIRRSLEFYTAMDNTRPVDKIILCGGTCKLRGFDVFMSDALNLPARVVQASSINFAATGEYAFDPSLAVAYGLALREVL
jgi:type IV pilus assembly protein PilM